MVSDNIMLQILNFGLNYDINLDFYLYIVFTSVTFLLAREVAARKLLLNKYIRLHYLV